MSRKPLPYYIELTADDTERDVLIVEVDELTESIEDYLHSNYGIDTKGESFNETLWLTVFEYFTRAASCIGDEIASKTKEKHQ